MKKCIVVSDSFKGTLSSLDICAAARRVIPECFPGCEAVTIPVADGGEGTVDCFIEAMGASPVTVEVTGVLGQPVAARYARLGGLAVVEMAAAAGRCVTKIQVWTNGLSRRFRRSCVSVASSSAEVASSRSRIGAPRSSARAMERRWA